ncbi:hypothetical protein PL78_14295 [Yersinia entomophaga]|uniref:Uncharacterized protein n=1 Tax=Yersinia entomophaga TaxID=935293 RepID=A0ABM6BNC8_YERET|nr:hypothetical protein [Yersinia entomophaga]ANI30989.1 hypothetical protein PL78_14295 [Yersinia entomophaga]OWF88638.1 hypothetical protein B4914_06715 [Yersinia entomophaga]
MNIALTIGTRSVLVSESRLERMISQDKDHATQLGLWDKIMDYFRPEKKQDAMNELYRLTHAHGTSASITLRDRVEIFNKIKLMSEPVYRDLFRVEDHPNKDNITFFIGEQDIYSQDRHSLLLEEQQFLSYFNMNKINTDQDLKIDFIAAIKRYISGDLRVQWNNGGAKQIFKDICRGTYNVDGFRMSVTDTISSEVKEAHLKKFINKLTEKQEEVFNIVGSQIGQIALIDTLLSSKKQFFFLGNPDKQAEFRFDAESGEIEVSHLIQQNVSHEHFMVLREHYFQENAHWYDGLSLKATFTIAGDGSVDCTNFHFYSKEYDGNTDSHRSE